MYSKSYIISNNDVNARFLLKVPAIFRLFQDVALLATRDAKVDAMSLSEKNIDWVIMRMKVEITRLPKCEEEIVVHTYPGKDMAMLYPRYFFITDKDNNVIIRSSSIWALIDSVTRKVIVDREVISKLPMEHLDDELPLPEKIKAPEDNKIVERRSIHYSDLDFNSHMNNVRYIEYLMDVHHSNFFLNHRIASINLNYLKEIKEKETITVYTDASNPETISFYVDDNLAFLCQVHFVND